VARLGEVVTVADSWTYWQREAAGQTDRGVTTPRVLALAVASVLATLLWAGGHQVVDQHVGGARSPSSACAELARLERQGIHSGPAFWDVQPECKARHKTRP
jgi:hypothetical protein